MNFADSLKNGKRYTADCLSYDEAKALALVCPVCKEKVFKATRRVPALTEYFAHHPGKGSADCENFHPSHNFGESISEVTFPKGQTFQNFIARVEGDLEEMIRLTQMMPFPFDYTRSNYINHWIDSIDFDADRNSLKNIPTTVVNINDSQKINRNSEVFKISTLISEFFQRRSARFIDKLVTYWFGYIAFTLDSRISARTFINWFVSDQDQFDNYASLLLVGLSIYYAKVNMDEYIIVFRVSVMKLIKEFNRRQEQLILKKEIPSDSGLDGLEKVKFSEDVKNPEKPAFNREKWYLNGNALQRGNIVIPLKVVNIVVGTVTGLKIKDPENPELVWINEWDCLDFPQVYAYFYKWKEQQRIKGLE